MKACVVWLLLLAATCSVAHVCLQDRVFDLRAMQALAQAYPAAATYPTDDNTQPIRFKIDTSYMDDDQLGMTCTSAGQRVKSSTSTQLYTCQDGDALTPNLRKYLGDLLDAANVLFRDTLKVIPVQGNLVLQGSDTPQGLYGGVYLSSAYTEGMPNTDIVVFVTARPILQDGGSSTETLAVARVVQEDQVGRPIFGHLNINPAGIDTSTATYARNFGVVIHEMTHALGFNVNKFKSINAAPGQPSNIISEVTLNVAAGDTPSTRKVVSSPRVVAWAQRYYGCPTVLGVELEDQGGQGTEGSHWEKRTTMNEYMTGTASRNPVFSELTLSLLEDTGWYRANYSLAGQLLWGQGMGCDFTNRACSNWPSSYNGYFCSDNSKQGCTADYQAKGECQVSTASKVPSKYQYFSDPYKVGSYDLPDYCPVTWGYENGWCFDVGAATSNVVSMGESFTQNSRCFTSSLAKGLALAGSTTSACYETYCTAPQELRVKINGYWYQCPAGSNIKVIGFGGTLTCPRRIEQICGTLNGTVAGSFNGTYSGGSLGTGWPLFIAISPNSGGPGTIVRITGQNFIAGIQVVIGDPLINVVVVSPGLITAVIPSSNRYKNPTNIIDQQESVIISDPKGRSTVGYNKFTIKVKLNKAFLENTADYLRDNWLVTSAIVVAIVVTCLVCGYCCYRQKGKVEEADTDYL